MDHPKTGISQDEKQQLVLTNKGTGKKVLDTTINTPVNKTYNLTLLNLGSEADATPQLLIADPVDPGSEKVNFIFYFDSSSGLFPQQIALKVVRFNQSVETYDLDGTTDNLAATSPIMSGRLSLPVSIDVAEDPFLTIVALSPYTLE